MPSPLQCALKRVTRRAPPPRSGVAFGQLAWARQLSKPREKARLQAGAPRPEHKARGAAERESATQRGLAGHYPSSTRRGSAAAEAQ
eukprot:scaffold3822_cov379-Prasinococcus_capsulatus_cf.AAC.2